MAARILAYAVQSEGAALAPFYLTRRTPRANDVVIKILFCGIARADLHQMRNDWGNSIYPMVPGHEIVGRVLSVGEDVSQFKVGDRVGVGSMVDTCQQCAACLQGLEQYCEQQPTMTYNDIDGQDWRPTFGGYAESIVVTEKFVFHLPAQLKMEQAAPLLGAGIASWSPLRTWQIGAGSKLAIVGLGGIGHLALKFAKALGAHVTLITRAPHKIQEGLRLGADQVLLSSDMTQMASVKNQYDLILDTTPDHHDLQPYLSALAIRGTLVQLGHPTELEATLYPASLAFAGKSIARSVLGSVQETRAMLAFCAQHGIAAETEIIAIQQIDNAYQRLLKNDVRYRFVLDMASLRSTPRLVHARKSELCVHD